MRFLCITHSNIGKNKKLTEIRICVVSFSNTKLFMYWLSYLLVNINLYSLYKQSYIPFVYLYIAIFTLYFKISYFDNNLSIYSLL